MKKFSEWDWKWRYLCIGGVVIALLVGVAFLSTLS